jgi:hypothetical protein
VGSAEGRTAASHPTGDGIGDLPGILSRLDYIVTLGITAVWLSPIYHSPIRDGGYDISDFIGVDPSFGWLEDVDRLVDALHARGIWLILDLVPNHTSDDHPGSLPRLPEAAAGSELAQAGAAEGDGRDTALCGNLACADESGASR